MDYMKLKNIVPDKVLNELPSIEKRYNINTPLRLSHFLSQCSHESGNFLHTVENLNYSSDSLLKVFPTHFNPTIVKQYNRNPKMIANRVYANRMGNGDERSGDGYKYRGRGYIQLTGKSNYILMSKDLNIDCVINPDLISNVYPLLSAGWFFNRNKLILLSDKGSDRNVIVSITKVINGGLNGLDDRIVQFNKYYNILKSAQG